MSIIDFSVKNAAFGLASSLGAALALASSPVSAGPLLGAVPTIARPLGAPVQAVGNAVTAVGQGHAGIAPVVYGTAPAVEPFADSVTNALVGVGGGLKATGSNIGSGGLTLTPVSGVKRALQTVKNGQLVQVHVGSLRIGDSPSPVVSVGALTGAPAQGSLATAGVANANALLNVNAAPQ